MKKIKSVENPRAINAKNHLPSSLIGLRHVLAKSASMLLTLLTVSIVSASVFTGCKKEKKPTVLETEINQVRVAVAPFTDKAAAVAAGYDWDVTGYRTHMGHHFLNLQLLDSTFDIKHPELILYAPYGSDSMKMVAVEYATPIADPNNPPPVPEGFTGSQDVWEINTEFHLWTLHVWVGLDNADGIFASHNHKLP